MPNQWKELQDTIEEPHISIKFQTGPRGEHGTNGCQIDDVLCVLIDRLKAIQTKEFACRENAIALTKLEEAMLWLDYRTSNRIAQGVEGTDAKHA